MLRAVSGLTLVLCLAGLATGQGKDKDKPKGPAKTKAILVKVDVVKKTLTVKIDGKETTLAVDKEVKFIGPQGGKATIKDDRLVAGAPLGLVLEGKRLREVHLPLRKDLPGGKGKARDKGKP